MLNNPPEWYNYTDLPNLTDAELLDVFSNHNHLSIEELREHIIPKIIENDGEFGFNGNNCDDNNCYWNGVDRRCNCGNRRVSWCRDSWAESPYYYGEAY